MDTTPETLTVAEALAHDACGLSPNLTAQARRTALRRLASLQRTALASKRVCCLTAGDVEAWHQQRLTEVAPGTAKLESLLLFRALRGHVREAGIALKSHDAGRSKHTKDRQPIAG
jgi:hypothetical protein